MALASLIHRNSLGIAHILYHALKSILLRCDVYEKPVCLLSRHLWNLRMEQNASLNVTKYMLINLVAYITAFLTVGVLHQGRLAQPGGSIHEHQSCLTRL